MTPRRAVVVAAGLGRRLLPYTDTMPKCLVPVVGRPMLARACDLFRAHGAADIVVVRGYRADVLEARRGELGPGVRFVDNPDYRDNNILESLFCAEAFLNEAFYFTYADIVFAPDVMAALAAADGDVCLVVDRAFRDVYAGRTDHPLPEAEVVALDATGGVAKVGKRALPADEAFGEFIGLAKVSDAGAAAFVSAWRDLCAAYAGRRDAPFQRAPSFRAAYLTDLLQHLIDGGLRVSPVAIDGRWREIDTVQDLDRAQSAVDW
ncbi:MAG TPA: phosphocholine cytidylyltransferase family protein [Haliangiales bacterium]|nr:phosphocholine cytidylyltransferase family protein [Haliangiales bacterium]